MGAAGPELWAVRWHGPRENPYSIKELATDEARRTSFRGTR
jgi:hypothetical protein